jgi:1-acyl-sn-glycerol-3-phosphate acyltransferase
VRPRYSEKAWRAFELAFGPVMRGSITPLVRTSSTHAPPRNAPILLAANHVSWWDGFLLRAVQKKIRPDAPMFTLMLERELRRNPWFRWMGALPLEPGSPRSFRRVVHALEQQRERTPEQLITFFPQGHIVPSWQRPLFCERGITVLASR